MQREIKNRADGPNLIIESLGAFQLEPNMPHPLLYALLLSPAQRKSCITHVVLLFPDINSLVLSQLRVFCTDR